ncbi:maleylpyruvate isomerase family mycothiol-dependent enzyme [Pimelobacter simplex]|uniref:maleylpyruvate isomerase family mycothiol-dependent enzyme n=1 Tax=Nocardioides simplex TaxID=2045 RepID=UPI00366E6B7A
MTRLGAAAYLDHIRTESARFADVLATCPPDARVPSCPDWTAADLLAHLGGVQEFWTGVIAGRPAAPTEDDAESPAPLASYADELARFRENHAAFVATLEAADPAEPAWSWSGDDDQNVAFTFRRQAHESLIHRLDAELVAGQVTPLPAELATDGIHEALDVIYGGLPAWGRFTPSEHYVEYRTTDTATSVWTQVGTFAGTSPEGKVYDGEPDQHVVADPGTAPALLVTGTASDLDAWLWHRGDDAGVTISGDDGVRALVTGLLGQAID